MRLILQYKIDTYNHKKLISIFRAYNTRSMILFYLLALKFTDQSLFTFNTLIAFIIFFTTYAFASIINFIKDKEIDKVNNRKNLYSDSLFNNEKIKKILFINIFVPVLLALLTRDYYIILGSFSLLILGFIYSVLKLSHNPITKLICMSLVYTFIPIFMGVHSLNISEFKELFLIGLLYTIILPYSDIKDIKGDKLYGKNTLVVKYGVENVHSFITLIHMLIFTYLSQTIIFQHNLFALYLDLILITLQLIAIFFPNLLYSKKAQQLSGSLLLFILIMLIIF